MKNNNRVFFYHPNRGKQPSKRCFWIEYANKKYLVSYQTVVCSVDNDGMFEKYWDDYSSTTQGQINAFIRLFDKNTVMRCDTGEIINGINKKEWLEMETSDLSRETYDYIKEYFPKIEWNCNYRNDYVKSIKYN